MGYNLWDGIEDVVQQLKTGPVYGTPKRNATGRVVRLPLPHIRLEEEPRVPAQHDEAEDHQADVAQVDVGDSTPSQGPAKSPASHAERMPQTQSLETWITRLETSADQERVGRNDGTVVWRPNPQPFPTPVYAPLPRALSQPPTSQRATDDGEASIAQQVLGTGFSNVASIGPATKDTTKETLTRQAMVDAVVSQDSGLHQLLLEMPLKDLLTMSERVQSAAKLIQGLTMSAAGTGAYHVAPIDENRGGNSTAKNPPHLAMSRSVAGAPASHAVAGSSYMEDSVEWYASHTPVHTTETAEEHETAGTFAYESSEERQIFKANKGQPSAVKDGQHSQREVGGPVDFSDEVATSSWRDDVSTGAYEPPQSTSANQFETRWSGESQEDMDHIKRRYILGKRSGKDIAGSRGDLLVERNAVITDEVIDRAEREGKLVELIVNMVVEGYEN